MNQIIEFAPFRIRAGTSRETLLSASRQLEQSFLAGCDGFLGKDLVVTGDNAFADIVRWRDQASAEAAMAKVMQSEACAAYFALMEFDVAAGESPVHHWRVIGRSA